MKKRVISLALALFIFLSALPAAYASDGADNYMLLEEIAQFIRQNGLYSEEGDDPIKNALINLLENDPDAFAVLMYHMLSSYDERTMYIPPEYAVQLQTSGYVGVGVTVELRSSGESVITDISPGGPAETAGLKKGDIIIAVDGKNAADVSPTELVDMLRGDGSENTWVTVSVRRDGKELQFSVQRRLIGDKEFSYSRLEDGTYYMKWTSFSTPSLMSQYRLMLTEMQASGAKDLIIDLRGNHGGILDMAFEIVDSLIPDANVHYLTIEVRQNGDMHTEKMYSTGKGLKMDNIVILCDGGSASASEMLMGALVETGYATSVGVRTYGKGTGQYEIELTDQSLIVITAMRVLTVKTGSYDLKGLYPFYHVDNSTQAGAYADIRLREIALNPGNCSDDAESLNKALVALGYLPGLPDKAYRFGEQTQRALDNLRQANALPAAAGLDIAAARQINTLLINGAAVDVTVDRQLQKALELIAAS